MDLLGKQKELYKNMKALTINYKVLSDNANNVVKKIEEIDNLANSGKLTANEMRSWKEFLTNSEEYEKIKRLILVLQYVDQPEDQKISNALLNEVVNISMSKKK